MHVLYLFLFAFLEAVEARVGIGISFIRLSSKRGPSMHHGPDLNRGTKKGRRP